MIALEIDVPKAFEPYLDAAIVRFSYLRPDVTVEKKDSIAQLFCEVEEKENLRREFFHALYREKIYHETLPLRRAIFAGLYNG